MGKKDTNSGLVGLLLVCKKRSLEKDGKRVNHGTYVQVCLCERLPETKLQRKGILAIGIFHFWELVSPNPILFSTPDLIFSYSGMFHRHL